MPQYVLEVITFCINIFALFFILITVFSVNDFKDKKTLKDDLIISLECTIITLIIAIWKSNDILQNTDFSITKIRIICATIFLLAMLIIITLRLKISKKGK